MQAANRIDMPRQQPIGANAFSFAPTAVVWLRLAGLYLVASAFLGVAMGASGDFTLRSVHSHISLLGWTTLAVAGVIYQVYPAAGTSRLARVHFWLYNLALPTMLGALTALLLGHPGAVPILATSQFVVVAGLLAFVANLFLNVKLPRDGRPDAP
jgi:hypothetical protein